MNVRFSSRSWAEYLDLHSYDAKLFVRVNELIEDRGMPPHPFKSIGKPQPLAAICRAGGLGGSAKSIELI